MSVNAGGPGRRIAMSTTMLTAAENGTVVEARVGDEIVVRLPENPTTGFLWQIDDRDGPIELVDDTFGLGAPGGVGAGGIHEFSFRASAPGSAHVALKHQRPWEPEGTSTSRYTFGVTISE